MAATSRRRRDNEPDPQPVPVAAPPTPHEKTEVAAAKVLNSIGHVPYLHKADARHLWDDAGGSRFRVNIWAGIDQPIIVHSQFVRV